MSQARKAPAFAGAFFVLTDGFVAGTERTCDAIRVRVSALVASDSCGVTMVRGENREEYRGDWALRTARR